MAAPPPHLETLLKTILQLEQRGTPVRAKDVAAALGLTRPTVSKAVAALARDDYLAHQPYLALSLTPKGRRLAEAVLHRQRVLRDFLVRVLGAKPAAAEADAHAVEQVMSRDTLQSLADFLEFLDNCRRCPGDVLRHFHELRSAPENGGCPECGFEGAMTPRIPEGAAAGPRRRRRAAPAPVGAPLRATRDRGPRRG